jgi:hypothetical protein
MEEYLDPSKDNEEDRARANLIKLCGEIAEAYGMSNEESSYVHEDL